MKIQQSLPTRGEYRAVCYIMCGNIYNNLYSSGKGQLDLHSILNIHQLIKSSNNSVQHPRKVPKRTHILEELAAGDR